MKIRLTFYLCFALVLSAIGDLRGQQYSLHISSESFTIEGKNYQGYSTHFVQPFKEVKKEWWRYINSRTIIFNKKTHLELTVPAKKKEANTSLQFVSQTIQNKKKDKTIIRMALVTDEVPDTQTQKLSVQAMHLLKDFKVSYYTRLIQEKIEGQELVSKKISMQMDKLLFDNSQLQHWIEKKPDEKAKFIKKLDSNTKSVEALQLKLNASQQEITRLKKELTTIK